MGLKEKCVAPRATTIARPQSNQRGIESPEAIEPNRERKWSLNRTSVGLKVHQRDDPTAVGPGPQSNQRGIEREATTKQSRTENPRLNRTSVGLKVTVGTPVPEGVHGLNRTSVGLKLKRAICSSAFSSGPQSNQRGIETSLMW